MDFLKQQFYTVKNNAINRRTFLKSCFENCKLYTNSSEKVSTCLNEIDEKFNLIKSTSLKREVLYKQLKETQALKSELSVYHQEFHNMCLVGEEILLNLKCDKEVLKTNFDALKKKWKNVDDRVSTRLHLFEELSQNIMEYEEAFREVQYRFEHLEDKICSQHTLNTTSCESTMIDRLQIIYEEGIGLKSEISKLHNHAQQIARKAKGLDSSELLSGVSNLEAKHNTVIQDLETQKSCLMASYKVVSVFKEELKKFKSEFISLKEEFQQMPNISRKLQSLKNQLDSLKKFKTRVSNTKKRHTTVNKMYQEIEKLDNLDHKVFMTEINTLNQNVVHLEECVTEREKRIQDIITEIESYNVTYSKIETKIKLLMKKEETFKAGVRDVNIIKQQQKELKDLYSTEVMPLTKEILKLNELGSSLIQSASKDADTSDLENSIENLNSSWTSLQESISTKEKILDSFLLQSGKFEDALKNLEQWLSDTEELISNQKSPSTDFKVIKAQLQEQKFLMKMLHDRQESIESLKALGSDLSTSTQTSELKKTDKFLKNVTSRFHKLITTAEQRMLVLEETMPMAQEFQSAATPLIEWFESAEKKLLVMSSIPVEEKAIELMLSEHEKFSLDLVEYGKVLRRINSTADKLKKVACLAESDSFHQQVKCIIDIYTSVKETSKNTGTLLKTAHKGIEKFTCQYKKIVSFLDKKCIELNHFTSPSVYSDKLENQLSDLKNLKESLAAEGPNIEKTYYSGEEILKIASGEESIQMKEKLDHLNSKVSQLSSKLSDRLTSAEECLSLVKSFYSGNNTLTLWLDSIDESLKVLWENSLDIQAEKIKKMENSIPEYKSVLETINSVGPRLCRLASNDEVVTVEGQISRTNERFERVCEEVRKISERNHSIQQRKTELISEIDELSEWFQDVEKRMISADGITSEPNTLSTLLKEQKALCIDLNSQKNKVRNIALTAKKLFRDSSSKDLSFVQENVEKLKDFSNRISVVCEERLNALEQAVPLAHHFFETHFDLVQWLDEVEKEIEHLEAPSFPVQIRKQQEKNKDLSHSVQEHKPVVDRLNKTASALIKFCKQEEFVKLGKITESDSGRYNALRRILREHQEALEEALQATSEFSDKLESILSALSSTAEQLNNAEPISAHPDRIQEQINDNKSVLQDLEKRTSTLEAVKKAAKDVIIKASKADEPAVKDIKMKLDRLNNLLATIQKAAHDRGKSLEEALFAAERFWIELTGVMKALKELENNLNCQEAPAVQPSIVQQQQDALKEIKEEITQTKPEVDNCRKAGHNLMKICGEPDKPDVQKHIEDLDSAWENITTLYAKREQNLIEAMEKSMIFHDTLHSLLEFLDTYETKFNEFSAVSSFSDTDALKREMIQLKSFKSEVDPEMVKVEALNRKAQELLEYAKSEQSVAIREPLSNINRRWNDLLKSIVGRQLEIENVLLKLGQFHHNLNEQITWITKTENTLDELKPILGDPSVIEVVLAKLKVVSNDIETHETSIDAIIRAGQELLKSEEDRDLKSTNSKLKVLQSRWQKLQNKATERHTELEHAFKEARKFLEDIQDLLSWLNEVDGNLVASKPVGGLPETAKEQLSKFMDLYNELEANHYKVDSLIQKGQDYTKRSGENSTKVLQHSLRTLKQKWDTILTKANDRKIRLEIALREAVEFHEALQNFVDWLTNAEKYFTSLKPASRYLKSVLEEIEEHRNFQKDLGAHREVMLSLDKKGTHLKYFSEKKDVILIKNLLTSVQHRWEKIVSKAAERTRNLDYAYKESKEFHDAWTSLSLWLDDAEKILDANVPVGDDPAKIKKLLSKHKEFQRNLGSKQVTYDNVMKTGRIIKEKCPKQDILHLQQMIDELKMKWNRVCSKAVDKQRKLEDALLCSGQFKDAVLSLMSWFDKAIQSLSEVKPYHGDFDTVTALIDQHKAFEDELKNRGLNLKSVTKSAVDLEKHANSPTDVENITAQVEELNLKWKTLCDLNEKKKSELSEALSQGEKLSTLVHMLLEWLSDAEMKLRFFGSLPEDEETTKIQINDHEGFLHEMSEKEKVKDTTLELAQSILKKAYPDAISTLRHWITILQSRFEEISSLAKKKDERLRQHLLALKEINDLLDNLILWLTKTESFLIKLENEALPEDLNTLDELIKEHQNFMADISQKQVDIEKVYKAFSPKQTQNKALISSHLKEKAKERLSHSGTSVSLKSNYPQLIQNYSDIKHTRARSVLEKYRTVWLLAMERQRRLEDRRNYLLELDHIKKFDFNEWRRRYLAWLNNKIPRILDQFKKMDQKKFGKVGKQEFIEGILKSKFSTNRLEMEKVADRFDINQDGYISNEEYIETLQLEIERAPKTEAEKIQDEVQRQVAKCTCVQRFKVFQVGEGKYRFGDSQKLRLVRILRSSVMVRVGGGWVALDEFLVKNDPCRAKGRTNLELREQFILADGVSQSMATFKPRPSPNPTIPSQSGTTSSIPSTGPITKIREKSERSSPMRQSHSSVENSSEISGPNFSETDTFSSKSRTMPSAAQPILKCKIRSRSSSRQENPSLSRASSDLSQDGNESKTNNKNITNGNNPSRKSTRSDKNYPNFETKIPPVKKFVR